MTRRKKIEAEADAIAARVAASKHKPCIVGRHSHADLVDALIVRKVSDQAIERELSARNTPLSDTAIRAHRQGVCSCQKT